MKKLFWRAHRWAGLLLMPFFVLILLSGMVLAMKPILAPELSSEPVGAHAPDLRRTVDALDEAGVPMAQIALNPDGTLLWTSADRKSQMQAYRLSDGTFAGEGGIGVKTFDFFKKLHKSFFVEDDIVTVLTYVMAAMMLGGLIFAIRPRARKKLMAWHNALGLWLFPLVLMLPLTGILMTQHIGAPQNDIPENASTDAAAVVRRLDEAGLLPSLTAIEAGKKSAVVRLVENGVERSLVMDEAGVFSEIAGGVYWPKVLHEGTWAGGFSGSLNMVIAALLLFFSLSGFYVWVKRRRHDRAARKAGIAALADEKITVIAYASQTGNAERLARKTAAHFTARGIAATALPLSAIRPEKLGGRRLPLICSTTGEGELPENARAFAAAASQTSLPELGFALLALGDSDFKNFCAGGKSLEKILVASGAHRFLDTVCADGNADAAWSAWMGALCADFGIAPPAPVSALADLPLRAVLVRKERLDKPGFPVREMWSLLFRLPEHADFHGGDLLLLTPPGEDFPRSYSVGGDAGDGNELRLTVALHIRVDGSPGRCSRWLAHELAEGESVDAVLRPHPSFRLRDDDRPVIMAATGSGIAPPVGFLPALRRKRREAWLFFGNAHREGDFAYRELWDEAPETGVLTRLSALFDNEKKGFIQDEMRRSGAEIADWLLRKNARVYVCGRVKTVGAGVELALCDILREHGNMSPEDARSYVDAMVAEERFCRDLFG